MSSLARPSVPAEVKVGVGLLWIFTAITALYGFTLAGRVSGSGQWVVAGAVTVCVLLEVVLNVGLFTGNRFAYWSVLIFMTIRLLVMTIEAIGDPSKFSKVPEIVNSSFTLVVFAVFLSPRTMKFFRKTRIAETEPSPIETPR